MRLGLSVGWDASASLLRWVHERAAVDVVVVGRLEVFEISGRDKSADTLTLVETGEYGFIVNEEGKLEYREKTELQEVPLYCRTDIGTVAASYRLWDARRGELVATVRHDLSTAVPSFCYRGDVPKSVERAARERLLRRLFSDLNEQFLADIVPRAMRAEMVFQALPGTTGGALVQSNELAILYASRNQWQLAVEMWRDCLRDRPDLAPVHYNLGLAHEAAGRFTLARKHLEQALTLDPREILYQSALRRVDGSGGG
jgi:tetratricopeptide (TPR) repeat protein